MVAQAYALKYPGSIQKLVLSNTLYSGEMWQANNDNCNYELSGHHPYIEEREKYFNLLDKFLLTRK